MLEFELVRVIHELARCEDFASVMHTLGSAARRLTGADGITLVLKEGDRCHYVDEDAIAPPWKGRSFPMESGISGWSMLNRQPVAIPDVQADPRIPHDTYRPTYVKSLAMVPIRPGDPIGALGVYWGEQHDPSAEELAALQALAEAAEVIRHLQQIDRMKGMLEDSTDALLLADRKLVMRRDLLDLRGIVRQSADRCRAAYRNSSLEMMLSVPETAVWITGDSVRLPQAIGNILEHARSRTPAGGRVSVRVSAASDALVSVQAIPARGMSARSLGLAVAKALINLHDGSFEPGPEGAGASAETIVRLPLRTGPVYLN
jgi:GAF domain-containing protein